MGTDAETHSHTLGGARRKPLEVEREGSITGATHDQAGWRRGQPTWVQRGSQTLNRHPGSMCGTDLGPLHISYACDADVLKKSYQK